MHTGIDPDQEHLAISPFLQVMPWPIYGKMSDHDLRAVYEYLKALPHADRQLRPRPRGNRNGEEAGILPASSIQPIRGNAVTG
jgi:hypothetical protein